MTLDQIGELGAALRDTHERSKALERFMESHPALSRSHICGMAALLWRVPFPSITGNPPVYKDRPYYDARKDLRVVNDELLEDLL